MASNDESPLNYLVSATFEVRTGLDHPNQNEVHDDKVVRITSALFDCCVLYDIYYDTSADGTLNTTIKVERDES